MKDTLIGWCHDTVNLWWGCTKVSEACLHCYAELLAKLFSRGRATWGPGGLRWIRFEAAARELLSLEKIARHTVPRRVFINSMSDFFEFRSDLNDARKCFFEMVPKLSHLRLMLLTKRPDNILRMVPKEWHAHWPAHVWLGTTVENQDAADDRIPWLMHAPAKMRFLSVEPMLGRIVIPPSVLWCRRDNDRDGDCLLHPDGCPRRLHWVICGGESGAGFRELDLDAVFDLYGQCRRANVPFFVKQDSGMRPGKQGRIGTNLWIQEVPKL